VGVPHGRPLNLHDNKKAQLGDHPRATTAE
jgi:hypothetical protein